MAMRAGRLFRHIEIQQPRETRDAAGGVVQTWETVATRPASLEPIADREVFAGGGIQAEIDHRCQLRYLAGLTPTMRVVMGERAFDIKAVREFGRKERVELLLRERL